MKKKNLILRIVITLVITLITYYITLPAMNLHYFGFYMFMLYIFIIFKLTGIVNLKDNVIDVFKGRVNLLKKSYVYIVILGVFILIPLINFICSPIFMSKSYAERIEIDSSSDFITDIEEVNFNALPLLDKESSSKLGDRVMGQMSELVSQFEVSNLYTQINYNNDIVRVTPLEYADFIKYFTNRKGGVKGYIKVNSVSGKTELVKLDKGMKYMPSALFNENLYRKLRFSYPTKIFGKVSFEIDNDGKPYWIVPTLKYTAVELKKEVNGLIVLDPTNGESIYYKVGEIPSWIDQVYEADLIIEQVDDWGMYKNGFINSIIGQKGVIQTTEGYNYTVQNDDVYLYTGITSINSDESNIGFILTNLRTKETKFYNVPGAEEYSAMDSAKGQVQQMDYTPSFPLLINLNNRATYLISLKDNAGLVKMYSFVDVEDYQKVVVTDSSLGIEEAARNYLSNVDLNIDGNLKKEKQITIASISEAIIDGVTYYYITDTENNRYKVSIKANENLLPFLKVNDVVVVNYLSEKEVTELTKIKK